MFRYLSISLVLATFTAGSTLRAATAPHADGALEAHRAWTDDDLNSLTRVAGLISVVGQPAHEAPQAAPTPEPQSSTEDPAWYAAQAASLNAQLQAEEANLRDYTQALEDVRELKSTTSGLNVYQDNIGLTPDSTIDILQSQVRETQSDLDALEDLARHHDIPPGVLRGEWQASPADTSVAAAESDTSGRGGDL